MTSKSLNLSKRRLKSKEIVQFLPCDLIDANEIVSLDLSYNDVDGDLCIPNLAALEKLRLSHCGLASIPQSILNLPMRNLDLSYNHIHRLQIPPSSGMATGLTKLCLQGNHLQELPSSIGELRCLKQLIMGDDLSGNNLRRIPDEIGDLRDLEEFYAARNLIEEFPMGLLRCKNLKVVNMAHNRLETFPHNLSMISALKTLDFSFNSITEISEDLSTPESLEMLDFRGNFIKVIPACLPLDKFELALNPCFFAWSDSSRIENLTLKQLATNTLLNVEIEEVPQCVQLCLNGLDVQQCPQCPLRFAHPAAEIVKPGELHGHHNVPMLVKVCSPRCILPMHYDADGALRLDESSLLDI